MVDLTKGISAVQGALQKTASQIANSKAVQKAETVANDTSSKVAEDIRKVEEIARIAKEHALFKLPKDIQETIDRIKK